MTSDIKLKLNKFNLQGLPENTVYIGVVGFEDRSLAFLKTAKQHNIKINKCIAIEYYPVNLKNRKNEFACDAKNIFSKIQYITYNRFCPEEFTLKTHEIVNQSKNFSRIVIDISGMSKMIIMILLWGLKKVQKPVSIIYARAENYHPTKEGFEKEKNKKSTNSFPYFLTSHVFDVVTTTELSSIAMQGAPVILITFPNFNYLEVAALLNTTNAQKLFLIESINNIKHNKWRLEAIRWLNSGLKSYINPITYEVDASDLNLTINILEKIYSQQHLTHKIILAPTGGKLQTVASFCLKMMHPDIHIIYPVVKKFAEEYTEGSLSHSEIFLKNFNHFTKKLELHRKKWLLNH